MTSNSVYYAWAATWNSTPGTGTDVQIYISHEILEAITDPNANAGVPGWISNTFCPGSPPCEIADNCEVTKGVGNYTNTVGVNCWSTSYYSNAGGGCVIPGIASSTNTANTTFTYSGGTLLSKCTIAMLFWGPAWTFTNSANPTLGTADEIKRGVQTLLTNTAFYNNLREYGCNTPIFNFAAIDTTTPPTTFQASDIQGVISKAINAGTLPNPQANADPILYFVILPSTAHYTINNQIGGHGTYQFVTAPPTSVPTTNPPSSGVSGTPAPPPATQCDIFKIVKLYLDKIGGSSWFLSATPNTDPRHVIDGTTCTTNADGSFKITGSGNITYHIAANNGFTEASITLNQATLKTQKFMQDAMDWTNVEQTCYYRINAVSSSSHNGEPSISHHMRGARNLNDATILNGFPKSCEASDYHHVVTPTSGKCTILKDLQHTAGVTPSAANPVTTTTIPTGLSAWIGKWIGIKTVVYNLQDGASAITEHWIDSNNSNIWTKALSYTDQGNWGGGNPACGGSNNTVITWGGPLCKFVLNNITDVDIKYASCREIDVFSQNPILPSPPSNTTPTIPPTSNPANNLSPIPPAANTQPPTTVATGTRDKFGVTEIYPSLAAGQSWYLSQNGLKGDSRVLGIPRSIKEIVNGDGSFHLSNNDDVLFYVSTLSGYSFQASGGKDLDHKTCRARQFIQGPKDWKNVEVTVFHNIDGIKSVKPKGLFHFGIKCRTGSHNLQGNCQGSCYSIETRCDPGHEEHRHRKEHFHEAHADDRKATFSFSSVLKRWVGEKFILFNVVDKNTGRVTGVRMEHWWNDSGDGVTWKKVNSTTDIGGWGFLDNLCGGNPDEIIIWGGPLIAFYWDDFSPWVNYKWMSIREIDTSITGGPPSPSPPSGPPPLPPAVTIGPNAYNVCKFVYSVIVDDSGGCNIGIDPNAHKGETQLGPLIPGTASQINMSGATTLAQRAGQKVINTSSLLYNKILAEAMFNLRIVGFPTIAGVPAPITCTIRRGVDDSIVATYGTINANVLSSAYQSVSFKTPSLSNYTLAVGDIVTLEFTGGDINNYVQVQTDTTSLYDGANGNAMDVVNGVAATLTGTDIAGGFWSTGQTGVQPTQIYNVSGIPPGSGGATVGGYPIYNGGPTKVAEIPVNGASLLIGKTIYEIDVWLMKNGNPTGNVSVYLLENTTGLVTYSFGSISTSNIPTVSAGPQQFNFFNYGNTHINTVNTYIVVEYSGGDINNSVQVIGRLIVGGNSYDGPNSSMYKSNGSSWSDAGLPNINAVDLSGIAWTSATPPPGTLPPVSTVSYNVRAAGSGAGVGVHYLYGQFWTTAMVGEILNDNQSKLIGTTISEVDLTLYRVGDPVGTLQIVIFNSAGALIASGPQTDASSISTFATNYRFLISLPTGYTLKAGDRIMLWMKQQPDIDPRLNYILVASNAYDAFDGNHSLLIEFAPTGQYPSYGTGGKVNVFMGYSGQWTPYTGQDIAGTFYF